MSSPILNNTEPAATTTMRAVVFKGPGRVAVETRPVPTLQHPRDAIVRVSVSALCGSDLHWYRGHQDIPAGFIPGHEFAGVVHQIGSAVDNLAIGDPVVATFTTQCGDCFYCRRNLTSRCEKSLLFGNSAGTTSIDGGQAEFVRVPFASSTLVKRPTTIPEHMAVLMGDIFPTGYFCASKFLKDLPVSEDYPAYTVVVGCGPVGICAIAAASTWCSNIFAVDLVPERLAEAEKLGATPVILGPDISSALLEATGGRGADVVLEVVGTPEAMQLCIDVVRPFGYISSIGVQTKDVTFQGPELYAKNVKDQLEFLCGTHMRLEDAKEAYERFDARKVHKVLFDI